MVAVAVTDNDAIADATNDAAHAAVVIAAPDVTVTMFWH